MVFYQFQQAGNEEYQSLKKWNSAVGTGSNGTMARTVVKFATLDDFAMIAKFTVHSENFCFLFFCSNDSVFVFLLSTPCNNLCFGLFL